MEKRPPVPLTRLDRAKRSPFMQDVANAVDADDDALTRRVATLLLVVIAGASLTAWLVLTIYVVTVLV